MIQGTPWHITKEVRMKNNDSRRDKRICVFFNREDGLCSQTLTKCFGSSHCQKYSTNPKEVGFVVKEKNNIKRLKDELKNNIIIKTNKYKNYISLQESIMLFLARFKKDFTKINLEKADCKGIQTGVKFDLNIYINTTKSTFKKAFISSLTKNVEMCVFNLDNFVEKIKSYDDYIKSKYKNNDKRCFLTILDKSNQYKQIYELIRVLLKPILNQGLKNKYLELITRKPLLEFKLKFKNIVFGEGVEPLKITSIKEGLKKSLSQEKYIIYFDLNKFIEEIKKLNYIK
ncbi:MAG: hypothetical protein IKJ33_01655 [Clostridia bacterium]|nr:hypothetical protein [Clostridia bacterium]